MKFHQSTKLFLLFFSTNVWAFAPVGNNKQSTSIGVGRISTHRTSASASNTQLQATTKPDEQRVVVTGLGVISGCGIGHEDFFQSCLDGKSSIGKVTRFDASAYTCQIGSEVPNDMFDPNEFFINAKIVNTNDRFTHLQLQLQDLH
jgi:3-oxoacyl-(acyl-carrier-protein) synthase